MNTRDFCYFLRGVMESTNEQLPSKEQWDKIVSHLKLVMQEVEKPAKWPSFSHKEFEEIFKGTKEGSLPDYTGPKICRRIGGPRYC